MASGDGNVAAAAVAGQPSTKAKPINPDAIGASGKRYEDEFEFEKQRIKVSVCGEGGGGGKDQNGKRSDIETLMVILRILFLEN